MLILANIASSSLALQHSRLRADRLPLYASVRLVEPIRKQKRWRWVTSADCFAELRRHTGVARVSWLSSPFNRAEVFSDHFHRKPEKSSLRIVNGFSRLPVVLALFSSN
jgi:hypothetical protein